MSEAMSRSELDAQHVELLPARTLMTTGTTKIRKFAVGGNGGNGGHGGNHNYAQGGSNYNSPYYTGSSTNVQSADAAAGNGGNGGSAYNG